MGKEICVRHMNGLVVLLAVIFLSASPSFAEPSPQEMYSKALRLSSQGAYKDAVELLREIIEDHPNDPIAHDAMFEIGEINEKFLGDYDAARQAYSLLIERFPNSKGAQRARTRLPQIAESGRGGDEPSRIFNEIKQQYRKIGGEEALARARQLYAKYPDFGRREDVLFWIAEEEFRRKDYEKAVEDYNGLLDQYPNGKWSYFALAKLGKAHIELRNFDNAIQAFEKLSAFEQGHPGAKNSSEDQIQLVHRFRILRQIYYLGLGIAAVVALLWLTGTRWTRLERRNVTGAILDVGILSIIYGVVVIAAPREPALFQTTLIYAWIAVCVAAFLNSLFLSSRTFSPSGRVLATFAAFLAVAAILYVVYYRLDAVNKLYDSIQSTIQERGA